MDSRLNPTSRARQPLLYAALAFSAGVLAGARMWRPPAWWLVALSILVGAAAYFVRRSPRRAYALALAGVAVVGAVSIQVRGPSGGAGSDLLRFADGRDVVMTAHVVADGMLKDSGFGPPRQRVEIETERVTSEEGQTPVAAGVRLTVYARASGAQSKAAEEASGLGLGGEGCGGVPRVFRYGERLRVKARLRPPHNFGNPGAFDYRGYLAKSGIVVLASGQGGGRGGAARAGGEPL